MSTTVTFSRDDLDLIVEFAGCSLDEKPGSNWVQGAGGLPDYICRIARAIKRGGKTTSQAISIAVSRVKVWATGKGVDKDTQAKAAEAVAAWEALRAKSKAKTAAKKTVKASHILNLSASSFNVDTVRQAWTAQANQWENGGSGGSYDADDLSGPGYDFRANAWIREMWTDYLIVETPDGDLYRVDYEVGDPDNDGDVDVSFDDPTPVKIEYVSLSTTDMVGHEISDTTLLHAIDLTPRCQFTAVETVLMSAPVKLSALDRILTREG